MQHLIVIIEDLITDWENALNLVTTRSYDSLTDEERRYLSRFNHGICVSLKRKDAYGELVIMEEALVDKVFTDLLWQGVFSLIAKGFISKYELKSTDGSGYLFNTGLWYFWSTIYLNYRILVLKEALIIAKSTASAFAVS